MNRKKLSTLFLALCLPVYSAMAQIITGESFLREVESSFQNIASLVLEIVSLAMGTAAVITLVMATIAQAKKEQSNKETILQWFTAFAIGFLCLEIIRTLIS